MVARQGDGKAHLVSLNGSTVIVLKGLNREVSCMKTQTITNILLAVIVVSMVAEKLPSLSNKTDLEGHILNHTKVSWTTDMMTGCQYILTDNGGVAPRMGRDGKQICFSEQAINLWNANSYNGILYELAIILSNRYK